MTYNALKLSDHKLISEIIRRCQLGNALLSDLLDALNHAEIELATDE